MLALTDATEVAEAAERWLDVPPRPHRTQRPQLLPCEQRRRAKRGLFFGLGGPLRIELLRVRRGAVCRRSAMALLGPESIPTGGADFCEAAWFISDRRLPLPGARVPHWRPAASAWEPDAERCDLETIWHLAAAAWAEFS